MEKNRKRKREYSNLPKGMRKGAYLFCYILAIPAIYGIIKYFIINSQSILMAFSEGELFSSPFTLDHFKRLFSEFAFDSVTGNPGPIFIATKNTLVYFGVSIVQQTLSYFVAYFLYKKIPGHSVFRFILFLPAVIAPVISVSVFKNLIRVEGPIWNIWEKLTGSGYDDLLVYDTTATKTIVAYCLLQGFGTSFLILVGAMNRIPEEIIESANLDGCKTFGEFIHIIFPLTWGTFSVFLLLTVAMIFTSSGPILYFTNGGAYTYTLGFWIFDQVRGNSTNYPAAIGVFFTVIGIPIVLIVRFITNKIDTEVTY